MKYAINLEGNEAEFAMKLERLDFWIIHLQNQNTVHHWYRYRLSVLYRDKDAYCN